MVTRRFLSLALAVPQLGWCAPEVQQQAHLTSAAHASWARGEHFVGAGGHVHTPGERNGPPLGTKYESCGPDDTTAVEFDLGDACAQTAEKGDQTVCLLPKSGTNIQLRFRRKDGKASASSDWIALYNPADSSDGDFVEYYWVPVQLKSAADADGWYSVPFGLLNLRQPWGVRYFEKVNNKVKPFFGSGLVSSMIDQIIGSDGTASTSISNKWENTYRCVARMPVTIDFVQGLLEPTQGRMQWTMRKSGDYSVRVTWTSGVPHDSKNRAVVQARVKDADGKVVSKMYAMPVGAESGRFLATDLCEAPANQTAPALYRDVGYFHSVILDDIPLDASVSYSFGQSEKAMSRQFTWESPKQKELTGAEKWSFLAYADHGVAGIMDPQQHDDDHEMGAHTPGSLAVNENVRRLSMNLERGTSTIAPRFALHFGDLAYAWSVGYIWELWHHEIEDFASTRPYMVSVGNHEYDHMHSYRTDGSDPSGVPDGKGFHPDWGNQGCDSKGECGVPVSWRWPMETGSARQYGGNGVFWYAFDYGQVHVAMISSEHDFTQGSPQYKWLEQDLKKQMSINNAHSTSTKDKHWLVVTAHRPGYNSQMYESDYKVGQHLSQELDGLLQETGVHLFLAGHYHSYERTCAVAHRKCADDAREAPVHLTVGSAGAWPDKDEYYSKDWSVSRIQTFGFLNLVVDGLNTIKVDFWAQPLDEKFSGMNKTAVSDFKVLDSVTVPFERKLPGAQAAQVTQEPAEPMQIVI